MLPNQLFGNGIRRNASFRRRIVREGDFDKQDIQYFHKNYLDHVMAVSDDKGSLLEHYRYTAFGEPEIYDVSGNKLTTSGIDNDILWNVRRYEAQTGLYMYLYRHYNAQQGRWLSRDPIEERGGINLYGFVRNNGVNQWDRLGLQNVCPTTGLFEPCGCDDDDDDCDDADKVPEQVCFDKCVRGLGFCVSAANTSLGIAVGKGILKMNPISTTGSLVTYLVGISASLEICQKMFDSCVLNDCDQVCP